MHHKKRVPLSNVPDPENNSLEGTLGAGINWSVVGMKNEKVVIERNAVVNPGNTRNADYPAVYRTGILDISNGTLTGCFIRNNSVFDSQRTPTMQFGIYHYGIAGDRAEAGLTIEGNTVAYKVAPLGGERYFIARKTVPSFSREYSEF